MCVSYVVFLCLFSHVECLCVFPKLCFCVFYMCFSCVFFICVFPMFFPICYFPDFVFICFLRMCISYVFSCVLCVRCCFSFVFFLCVFPIWLRMLLSYVVFLYITKMRANITNIHNSKHKHVRNREHTIVDNG